MKHNLKIIIAVIFFFSAGIHAMNAQNSVPSVIVTDFDGARKNIRDLLDTTKITLLVFWNVWSHISQKEIDDLAELKDELNTKYNTEVILISMDDSRNSQRVQPIVNSKSWQFKCYIDLNGDLKRAFNISQTPSTVIISSSLNVLWSKLGYYTGDEEIIISKIKEIK